VWSEDQIKSLVSLCRAVGAWLLLDETYQEFTYETEAAPIACGKRLGYGKIIHISTFSKAFGMMGWRVGYLAYPAELGDDMRKINDTIPTHTALLSQKLAVSCLEIDANEERELGSSFVTAKVRSLVPMRKAVWDIVKTLGTIKTYGAFYFLVPVPGQHNGLTEDEAVDILATQFKVILLLLLLLLLL